MAAVRQDMGRQHTGRAGLCAHFLDQFVGRAVAVHGYAWIAFIRDHGIAHESFDAGCNGLGTLSHRKSLN